MHSNTFEKMLSHFLGFLLMLLLSTPAWTEDQPPEFISLIFENDFFVGDDGGYTNGMGITLGKGPFIDFDANNLPSWLYHATKGLYISTLKNKQRGVGHLLFQRMQTPQDISSRELIGDDLPYAGLLAWRGTLYAWDDQVSDQLSLYLGVVGPMAFAKQSQTIIHRLLGSEKPKGWNHQIGNELVFNVEAQRALNLYRSNGKLHQFDIIGLYGAGVGNLESATKAGLAIRWGSSLAQSFATFLLDADRQANALAFSSANDFYLFFGAKVGVVFNNILIEGNTLRDSHSAPLKHYQNQISAGAAWSLGNVSAVLQLSSLSSQTKLTDERDTFGAISFSYAY